MNQALRPEGYFILMKHHGSKGVLNLVAYTRFCLTCRSRQGCSAKSWAATLTLWYRVHLSCSLRHYANTMQSLQCKTCCFIDKVSWQPRATKLRKSVERLFLEDPCLHCSCSQLCLYRPWVSRGDAMLRTAPQGCETGSEDSANCGRAPHLATPTGIASCRRVLKSRVVAPKDCWALRRQVWREKDATSCHNIANCKAWCFGIPRQCSHI